MTRRLALLLVVAAGCGGATSDPGLRAHLRVDGAQFQPGPMPEDAGGPKVLGLQLVSARVVPGELGRSLQVSVDREATALIVGLDGDVGYYTVPSGSPDTFTGLLTFNATLSFSPLVPIGTRTLMVRALDADGRAGAAETRAIEIADTPAEGRLVVSLAWTADADLDLHVVDPSGVEIWARNPSSYENPRPGSPPDPNAVARAGVLDHDSNSGCLIDGRRRENVVWKQAPPPGTYTVRVDTASLCGEPAVAWTASAALDGTALATARGIATANDADRFTHGRGGGLTAFTFDVP